MCLHRPLSAGEARAERRPSDSADWTHVFQVIDALKAKPPKVPVVYLLGGSAAASPRSATRTGPPRCGGSASARAYLQPRFDGQTYAQGITVVNDLPAVPSIVLIGVDLGRYVPQPVHVATRAASSRLPAADAARAL